MIPDLRQEQDEVTVEHCSVLLERLTNELHVTFPGTKAEFREICNHIDPVQMKTDIQSMFTDKAFLHLFKSDLGKGVLIGSFVQRFILDIPDEFETY